MRIAYQGEPGAYSEAAALRFSPHAETIPCESFDQVFAAVQTGKATHGILPIENSIGGSIHRNYDLLLEHELPVVAEVLLQVSHNLLAFPGTTMKDIKKVYSHPQGLAQCEGFLSSLKGVEIVATYDTAGSAKMIRDQEIRDAAAIASARAAEVFGLVDPGIGHPGLQGEHHALHPDQQDVVRSGKGRQDDDRVHAAEHAGCAVQGAERVCAA